MVGTDDAHGPRSFPRWRPEIKKRPGERETGSGSINSYGNCSAACLLREPQLAEDRLCRGRVVISVPGNPRALPSIIYPFAPPNRSSPITNRSSHSCHPPCLNLARGYAPLSIQTHTLPPTLLVPLACVACNSPVRPSTTPSQPSPSTQAKPTITTTTTTAPLIDLRCNRTKHHHPPVRALPAAPPARRHASPPERRGVAARPKLLRLASALSRPRTKLLVDWGHHTHEHSHTRALIQPACALLVCLSEPARVVAPASEPDVSVAWPSPVRVLDRSRFYLGRLPEQS